MNSNYETIFHHFRICSTIIFQKCFKNHCTMYESPYFLNFDKMYNFANSFHWNLANYKYFFLNRSTFQSLAHLRRKSGDGSVRHGLWNNGESNGHSGDDILSKRTSSIFREPGHNWETFPQSSFTYWPTTPHSSPPV